MLHYALHGHYFFTILSLVTVFHKENNKKFLCCHELASDTNLAAAINVHTLTFWDKNLIPTFGMFSGIKF